MTVEERVLAVIEAHRGDRGALLPVLHGIQAEFGYVDPSVIPLVARELNLSRADVHGVVTFYRDFRAEPAGRVTVRLCRAEACRSVGSEPLAAHAEAAYGVRTGRTGADGALTLEEVFCLGNCALGPAAQVNGRLHGRLDPARLDGVIAAELEKRTA
ncbi:NAD(P)H-dependent oxidoreductase subunit E [Actinosynnema sp. NPDC059335]|uniref:NAD(P)H-dependent oxidoreductase subunit E n=1 Tax=Actinosynnema sp. NPDC059335 TaxID=3346804 RepID=UPI0036726B9F